MAILCLPSKMADNILADDRWPPILFAIFSISEFSRFSDVWFAPHFSIGKTDFA